jgi:hypothetical protein
MEPSNTNHCPHYTTIVIASFQNNMIHILCLFYAISIALSSILVIFSVLHCIMYKYCNLTAQIQDFRKSKKYTRYVYIFTSGMVPAAHGICATGNHIRCAAGKLFSSSKESSHGARRKWASERGWAARSPWCPLYRVPRGQGEAHVVHYALLVIWLLGSCHTVACITTLPSLVLWPASWSWIVPSLPILGVLTFVL